MSPAKSGPDEAYQNFIHWQHAEPLSEEVRATFSSMR